jgi:Sulfotransferase family
MATVSPLVHVGYPKTGTTWLQLHVLRSRELGFKMCGDRPKVTRHLVAPHDLDFDPDRCRERFRPCFERAAVDGLVPVLSAERLCGDLEFGSSDSARLAERVSLAFPAARVLLVIREQRDMLFSSYQLFVRKGGELTLGTYLVRPRNWGPHAWPCDLHHFEYDRLIAHYHDRFGSTNVLVLPFELFRDDAQEFVRRVIRFGGASAAPGAETRLPFAAIENPSWPAATLAIKRHLNHLVRERLNPSAPLRRDGYLGRAARRVLPAISGLVPDAVQVRLEVQMRAEVAEVVGSRYRSSNARTEALAGLCLREYGYDVAESAGGGDGPQVDLENVTSGTAGG